MSWDDHNHNKQKNKIFKVDGQLELCKATTIKKFYP